MVFDVAELEVVDVRVCNDKLLHDDGLKDQGDATP